MPISSLDRYNHSCWSSHAVKIVTERSSSNALQRPCLDTIGVMAAIHEMRTGVKLCPGAQALLWGTEDCPGSAAKAAQLCYGKQTQTHTGTKVTPKGRSLSDTKDLNGVNFGAAVCTQKLINSEGMSKEGCRCPVMKPGWVGRLP